MQGTPQGVPFFVEQPATVLGNYLPGTGLYPAAGAAYAGKHGTRVRFPAGTCGGRLFRAVPAGSEAAFSWPLFPGMRQRAVLLMPGKNMDRMQKAAAYRKELGKTEASPLAGTEPELAAIRERLEYGEIAGQGSLDARQRRLITLVVLAAIQTPEGIGEETRAALHQGVRPEEIREALYQCAPYSGFPRTEAALRHADAALEAAGIALPLPEGGTVTEEDRFEKGLAVQTGIFGDAISKMHASAPEGQREILVRHLSAFCFGDIYTRTGLDLPLRELLTFCIISALGGCEAQVKAHVQGNAAVGNGKQLLVDALLQMLPSIGFPRTLNALACVNSVLPEA